MRNEKIKLVFWFKYEPNRFGLEKGNNIYKGELQKYVKIKCLF